MSIIGCESCTGKIREKCWELSQLHTGDVIGALLLQRTDDNSDLAEALIAIGGSVKLTFDQMSEAGCVLGIADATDLLRERTDQSM
jgi:hypothetical protein